MGTMNNDFAARQSTHDRDLASRVPLVQMSAAPAREEVVPTSRAHFFPTFMWPWQRERTERLHRFCKSIERRRAAGVSVRKAVTYFAWFWKDRPYRTAPHIKARFSGTTLVILYYRWRRNGKSPACFVLRYSDRMAPVTREQMRRFLGACGKAGTESLSQATTLAGLGRAAACRIRTRLPRPLVRQIKGNFKERRQAKLKARAAVKHFRWQMRVQKAAESARSRKLKRLADSFVARRGVSGVDSTSRRAKAPIQATGAIFKRVLQGVGKRVARGVGNDALAGRLPTAFGEKE